jgi:hypothetical protein
MTRERSYLELADLFRRILRETTRLEDALRIFDAQRVRMLALRENIVGDVAGSVAMAFGASPAGLLSEPHLGRDGADARALLAHILTVRGWTAERLAELLGEDIATVRAMADAVTRRPSLMTLARLALESASSTSSLSPNRPNVAGPPSAPIPSSIPEPRDVVRPCRDG